MKIKFKNNMSIKRIRFRRGQVVNVPGGVDVQTADMLVSKGCAEVVDANKPKARVSKKA